MLKDASSLFLQAKDGAAFSVQNSFTPTADGAAVSVQNSFTATADGQLVCRLCCAILATAPSARRHLTNVHLKQRNFTCQHCSKRFGQKTHAKRHEKTCPQASSTCT